MKKLMRWRKGAVVYIETTNNIFVLAQLLESPYIHFFNYFIQDNLTNQIDLDKLPTLFVKPVLRQFIKQSNILVTAIRPLDNLVMPKIRIVHQHYYNGFVTVWENTPLETTFICMGADSGAKLVKNLFEQDEEILIENIDPNDNETLEKYELNNLSFYPELNERLYLCYLFGKKIDPNIDLILGKPLPTEYYKYIQIIAGKTSNTSLGY